MVKASRDVKDNYLLALSFDGNADYLLTGDMDLLVLERINDTQIIKLNTILELHNV